MEEGTNVRGSSHVAFYNITAVSIFTIPDCNPAPNPGQKRTENQEKIYNPRGEFIVLSCTCFYVNAL